MNPANEAKLEHRVRTAFHQALTKKKYVTAIDIFLGMGILLPTHVDQWRKGRVPYLEQTIQINLKKLSFIMHTFRKLAAEYGLNPSETKYLARTRGPSTELQFSKSGDPSIEKWYCTHFVSPELKEEKKQKLAEKLSKPPELVVFLVIKDRQCHECGTEIPSGTMLFMEKGMPLCLCCADLDHLIFLSRGDAALTRRATKYSSLRTVVVEFSRSRNRYERQGILVEEMALEKAQAECESDKDKRLALRATNASRQLVKDGQYAHDLAQQLKRQYPSIPEDAATKIAAHTTVRGSGRIGRTAAAKEFADKALELAVIAHIRHCHTDYDSLLMQGMERSMARAKVKEKVDSVFVSWRK